MMRGGGGRKESVDESEDVAVGSNARPIIQVAESYNHTH
jgi:hypothetical protein